MFRKQYYNISVTKWGRDCSFQCVSTNSTVNRKRCLAIFSSYSSVALNNCSLYLFVSYQFRVCCTYDVIAHRAKNHKIRLIGACSFHYLFENDGLLKVTGSHVHCKCGNISSIMLDGVVDTRGNSCELVFHILMHWCTSLLESTTMQVKTMGQ